MSRIVYWLTCALVGLSASPTHAAESELELGRFGRLALYAPSPEPARVVLFVSGDGGWNLGVVDMARELATLDALVVGIDITHYLKSYATSHEPCAYFAGDLESLSQFVQKRLGFQRYHRPILVGYSSGATLVYAALAQAPAGTFAGAISLGFCPDLMLDKATCRGAGLESRADPKRGLVFAPVATLSDPWVALQGDQDQVCDPQATARFVGQVRGGEVVHLPKVGHGFSVPRNWMPQLKEALTHTTAAAPPPAVVAVPDLPLVEVPVTSSGETLALLLTGAGGWAGLDRELAGSLSRSGIPVIGWDSLRYFWTARTPEGAAHDLERVLRHYLQSWERRRVVLVGYSQGADVLPFLASRLPPDLRARVALVALLGPSNEAHFELQLTTWLGGQSGGLPVAPEVARLTGLPLLCAYGQEEQDSLCPTLPEGTAEVRALAGGHHFGGDYDALAAAIIEASGHTTDRPRPPPPSRR